MSVLLRLEMCVNDIVCWVCEQILHTKHAKVVITSDENVLIRIGKHMVFY